MERVLEKLYFKGIKAVIPEKLLKENIKLFFDFFKKHKKKVVLISIGKASSGMAKAAILKLKEKFYKGILITKYGYSKNFKIKNFKMFEAGHPVPDKNGLNATKEVLKLIKEEKKDSIFFILISGGASSLFVYPRDGITLKDKIKTTEILLNSGADINELNCIRKHLSKVKGGNLGRYIYPSPALSFIISDVISDKLDVIGSGPTSPDNSNFKDAFKIIKKYKIQKKLPKNVLKILKYGIEGKIPENPKKGDKIFKNLKNYIIGKNEIGLKEIKKMAEKMGIKAKIISKDIKGEAKVLGKYLAKIAIEEKEKKIIKKPLLLIYGGETTVQVKGKGKGGRAQELALSFALKINGLDGIYLLSASTDGTDGKTDAAGAIVDGKTIKKGKEIGLDAKEFLKNNDSYNFFKKINSLFITGPTGTNVMDFYLILIK